MGWDRMTNGVWGDVRKKLRDGVGESNFITWIAPLELTGFRGGVAQLAAPTNFIANWVNRNFADQILGALNAAGAEAHRLDIAVQVRAPAEPKAKAEPEAPAPRAAPAGDELPGAPLDARYTFDNFVVGKPNALAHAAARRVAEGAAVTFNPLFLYGGVGLGKTHLMHAIAWEIQARNPEARVLYLSAEQFMYRFVQALRERHDHGLQVAVPLGRHPDGR